MTDLTNIQVGDLIVYTKGFRPDRLLEVTKVTNKQFIAGNKRFWKKNGHELGSSSSWYIGRTQPATLADANRIRSEHLRRENENLFSGCRVRDLSDNELAQIAAIIKEANARYEKERLTTEE